MPVPELVDLMKKCWNADMVKRPTANIVCSELEKLTKPQNQDYILLNVVDLVLIKNDIKKLSRELK